MKISAKTVKRFATAVRTEGVVEEIDSEDGEKLQVFHLEDVTLSFTVGDKKSLYGILFEAIGREFTLTSSLDLLVSLPQENGEEGVFEVEDSELLEHIEKYLEWRSVALETFHI